MRLSQQNLYGTIGFAIFAVVGMVLACKSHLVEPLELLSNVDSTTATLQNEYTERTRTRRGISSTSYTINYTFEANGKKYAGQCPISDRPQQQMTVYYDRRNPMVNGMELRGDAYFRLGLFGAMGVVLLVCIGALVLHGRSGARTETARDPSEFTS